MKIYVSFDGDHIGRMIGRAALADKPEEVRRISQDIDRGNQIWRSWAEAQGGNVISMGGDEGRLEVEADHLPEIPKLRQQYKACVDSTVSVGVGMKLSEADKALLAAKLQGGDRIQLYAPEVETILEHAGDDKGEGAKIVDEYLNPSTGLKKAVPAPEGSEHSEVEALQGQIDGAPDFESMFHRLAQQQAAKEATMPQVDPTATDKQEGLRQEVVKILQSFKGREQELAAMKQQDPDLYQSVMGLVQGLIQMARQVFGDQQQPVAKSLQKDRDASTTIQGDSSENPETPMHLSECPHYDWDVAEVCGDCGAKRTTKSQPEGECKHFFGKGTKCLKCKKTKEDLEKAALEAGKTGRHDVNLPSGSQIDAGPAGAHKAGEIKVTDPATGKTKWRQVRAGQVMAPDGTVTSSRNPNPTSGGQ